MIFASWPGYVGTLSPVHFARRESGDPPGDIINKQSANLANLYLPTSARYNSSSQLSSSEFARCSDLNEIDDNDTAIILFKHCSSNNMIACPSWNPIASQAGSALLFWGQHSIVPLPLMVGVGGIWSMARIPPWGNVR